MSSLVSSSVSLSLTLSPPLFSSSSLPSGPALPLHTPQLTVATPSPRVKFESETLEPKAGNESNSTPTGSNPANSTSISSSSVPASALSILTSMKNAATASQANSVSARSSSPNPSPSPTSTSLPITSSLPSSSLARRSSFSSTFSPSFGSVGFKSNFLSSVMSSSATMESLKEVIGTLGDSLNSFPPPTSELKSNSQLNPQWNNFIDAVTNFRSSVELSFNRLNELKSILNGDLPVSDAGLLSPSKSNPIASDHKPISDSNSLQLSLTHSSPASKLNLPPFVSASPSSSGAFHSSRPASLPVHTPMMLSTSSTFKSPSFAPLGNSNPSAIPSINHSHHSTSYYPSLSPIFTSNSSSGAPPVGISPRIQALNAMNFSTQPITRIPSNELPGQQNQLQSQVGQPSPTSNLNLPNQIQTQTAQNQQNQGNTQTNENQTNATASTPTNGQTLLPTHSTTVSHSITSKFHSNSTSNSHSKSTPTPRPNSNSIPVSLFNSFLTAKRGRGRLQKCEKHRKWKKSCPPNCPDKPKQLDENGGNEEDSMENSDSQSESQSNSDSQSDSDSSSSSDSNSDSSGNSSQSSKIQKKRKKNKKKVDSNGNNQYSYGNSGQKSGNRGKSMKMEKIQQIQPRNHEGIMNGEMGFNNGNSHLMSSNGGQNHSHPMGLSLQIPAVTPTGMGSFPISPYNSSILSHLQGGQPGTQTMFAPAPFTPSNSMLFQNTGSAPVNSMNPHLIPSHSHSHSQSSPFFQSPGIRAVSYNNSTPTMGQQGNHGGMQFQTFDFMSPQGMQGNGQRRF